MTNRITEGLFCQTPVIGSIKIGPKNHPDFVQVTSNSDFFKTPIKYNVKDGCIYFTKPGIDDNKRIVKPTKMKAKGWYIFNIKINSQEIEFKKYEFDEESTDEMVIIYYL